MKFSYDLLKMKYKHIFISYILKLKQNFPHVLLPQNQRTYLISEVYTWYKFILKPAKTFSLLKKLIIF